MRTLANHHLLPVVNTLLDRPLPYSPHAVRALQVLAKDSALQDRLIDHLTDIVNNGQLYDHDGSGAGGVQETSRTSATNKVPQPLALCATAALAAVLEAPEATALANKHYALLFSTLVMRAGTAQASKPVPADANFAADATAEAGAAAALRAFLDRAGEKAPLRALNNDSGWATLAKSDYAEAIIRLVAAVAGEARPGERTAIFERISPYCKGNFIEQRLVAVAVIGELVQHTPHTGDTGHPDDQLLQLLVQALLAALIDPPLKRFALRGLGNIVAAGESAVNHYAPTVLDALTSSMEHVDEAIVLEAMAGLSKVFNVVERARVQPILVNICHR